MANKQALFGGEVSEAYAAFLKINQPIFDATLAAMRRDLGAIGGAEDGAGLKLLDIAAGPGQPSLTIAEAFPHCAITCTDISPDMVEKAKARAPLPLPFSSPLHFSTRAKNPEITCHSCRAQHVRAPRQQGNLAAHPNVSFAVVDASDLSAFPDASFDVVSRGRRAH